MNTTTYINAPTTLDALFEIMKAGGDWDGSPQNHGDLDWSELPKFGGETPADTSGVWSWDEKRLIVGESPDSIDIITRAEWVE